MSLDFTKVDEDKVHRVAEHSKRLIAGVLTAEARRLATTGEYTVPEIWLGHLAAVAHAAASTCTTLSRSGDLPGCEALKKFDVVQSFRNAFEQSLASIREHNQEIKL